LGPAVRAAAGAGDPGHAAHALACTEGAPATRAGAAARAGALGLRAARHARPAATALLERVADAEPAPVAAIHVARHGKVEHELLGVAAVNLQRVGIGVRAHAAADAVAEDALGSVADQVLRAVAGHRLAVTLVVGRHVAVRIGADREHDPRLR